MNTSLLDRIRELAPIVGHTPVQRFETDTVEAYCKLEFLNLTGSLKDRPAFHVLQKCIESGEITPDTTIFESSSGNFASALAMFAKHLKLNFVPVIDPNIAPAYESFLNLACGQVAKVTQRDIHGGYQRTRIATVNQLLEATPNSYWPNQYANPLCMDAHYLSTGGEICRQIDHLDFAFIGVSSGGTIAGLSNRLKENYPNIKIIAVDAQGSAIFSDKTKKRYIPGIGSTSRPALLDHARIDEVVMVEELDTVQSCRKLLNDHAIFAGGSTGTAFAAIESYFQGHLPTVRKPKVLFLGADRGHAYQSTVYDAEWCNWLGRQHQGHLTLVKNTAH